MHNGEAQYASNAGKAANADDAAKLNGLAPEAYIQPQDNILDDGHFKINQQTKKIYDNPGYTVDRWRILGEYTKAEVVDDGIKITTTQPTLLNIFLQPIEVEKDLIGEELAATVELGDSSNGAEVRVHAYSSDNSLLGGNHKFVNSNSVETFHFVVPENTKRIQFIFRPTIYGQETFFVIKRAKLEKGRRFTGWPVWNYALELAKCQRYYFNTINKDNYAYITMAAVARTNNRLMAIVNAPVSMRIRPTPKIVGKIIIRRYNAVTIKEINENIASINCYSSLPWNLSLDITLTDGTTPFVAGEYYNLIIENMTGNYLEFNANL